MYREVTMIEVREVLRLRGEGLPKKRIAAQLGPDPKTIRRYLEAAATAGVAVTPTIGDDAVRQVLLALHPGAVGMHRLPICCRWSSARVWFETRNTTASRTVNTAAFSATERQRHERRQGKYPIAPKAAECKPQIVQVPHGACSHPNDWRPVEVCQASPRLVKVTRCHSLRAATTTSRMARITSWGSWGCT
jgi:hypothetical protein